MHQIWPKSFTNKTALSFFQHAQLKSTPYFTLQTLPSGSQRWKHGGPPKHQRQMYTSLRPTIQLLSIVSVYFRHLIELKLTHFVVYGLFCSWQG